MNIFYLHTKAVNAAADHCDKHVVKMILESSQLLSTAHRVLDGEPTVELSKANRKIKRWKLNDWREEVLYKATHVNHPSAVWVRESKYHYRWLANLNRGLCSEYYIRYNKQHACTNLMLDLLHFYPDNIKDIGFTEPPQCMPDECKVPGNAVQAYRNYYMQEKRGIAEWRYTEKPEWYE
jgi:hypothetical protein